MANSENTITSAFVNVLRHMRGAWNVNEQITRPFLDATQKPDVIVTEKGRNPVVIEVKVDGDTPNFSGEIQAEAHFGMLLDPGVFSGLTYNIIENVLRVRMPARFRTMPQDKIDSEMRRAEDIAYILLNKPESENEPAPDPVLFIAETEPDNETALESFPQSGWLNGSVADIATAIRVRATPISQIDAAADLLEKRINVDIGFSANSLGVLFTEKSAIGGSSLPNVVLKKPIYDYVWTLWGNSTLGLLLHWAHSSKQQPGRGRGSRTALLQMPTLDVRCLSNEALANAERIFHTLKHQRMLPFNEIDHDPVRHELDRLLLTEVLNITSEDAHNAIHRLRELLSAEPSIHGGKKSRCNLEKEWEKFNQ